MRFDEVLDLTESDCFNFINMKKAAAKKNTCVLKRNTSDGRSNTNTSECGANTQPTTIGAPPNFPEPPHLKGLPIHLDKKKLALRKHVGLINPIMDNSMA